MRVRFGLLKEFLYEAALSTRATSRSAPTDPDAQVPGHLPDELPDSASLDEQAWVPGRWMPGEGEPLDAADRERLGDTVGSPAVDETDDRMEDDGKGNGIPDPDNDGYDMADHLRGDEEKTSLGDPPDETMEEALNRDIAAYLLQEGPAGAGMVDPTDVKGFYTPFDMTKDHTGTDDLSSTWYKSPGREPGTDGDPFRGEDPHAQLGFHAAKGSTPPPGASGEEGNAARRAPDIWQLSAGSDTSKVLGANAKPETGGGESEGEPGEEGEEGEGGEGAGEEGGSPEGEEQG